MMRRGGFTLLELLVSMAILSVVSTLAVTAFISANDYWNGLRARIALDRSATAALDSLRGDFGKLVSTSTSGGGLRGIHGTVTDDSHSWRTVHEDDQLEMPVEQLNVAEKRTESAVVAYRLERGGDGPILVRTARGGAVSETVVAPNVVGLRFAFFDGEQWLDAWEPGRAPRAVRVSLSLADPRRPGLNLARTAVFNVNVP